MHSFFTQYQIDGLIEYMHHFLKPNQHKFFVNLWPLLLVRSFMDDPILTINDIFIPIYLIRYPV